MQSCLWKSLCGYSSTTVFAGAGVCVTVYCQCPTER